jgi:predicted RNA polymerase sigma factor
MGDIEASLGRMGEAMESFQSALSYAPDSSTRKRIKSKVKTVTFPK